MMRKARTPLPPRRPRWRRAVLGLALVAALGVGGWWVAPRGTASGGTPRLVVDRTDLDLGAFAFQEPARAVFTLGNAGDGVLKVVEVLPVKALKGC